MMSIKEQVSLSLEGKAVFVGSCNMYNYHKAKYSRNLDKLIKSLPALHGDETYLVIVGKIGKSAHSATCLLVYKTQEDITTKDVCYRNYWYY